MSDDVTFQTSVTATPPNATRIATDNISGAHHQLVKVEFGDNGTAYALAHGTPMPIGTLPGGTLQLHGTGQMLGTFQPLAGSVHLASGTVTVLGTIQIHGTAQALGTFQQHGTSQGLGTYQPLAGSVHLANAIPAGNNNIGDVDIVSMPTVTVTATNLDIRDLTSASDSVAAVQSGAWSVDVASLPNEGQQTMANSISVAIASNQSAVAVIGTFQSHGTNQALGTIQPLAGSVHIASGLAGGTVVAVGSAVHGAVADARPQLFGAFGSSGTQAAVDDGDAVRLWADLNGRLQIRGTIDSMPAVNVATGTIPGGTVQLHGTSEILGTVRALTTVNAVIGTIQEGTINSFTGTAQVLGTIQALLSAGSVQGWQANGGVVAGNPVLWGGFGSSGTQAAVDDGDVVRAWFDLNGRQQIRGTIDSIPAITIGAALPAGNNNIGDVDVASMPTVTVQATNLDIRDLTSASDSVAVVGSVSAQGYVAHDAAAAGNPILLGGFGSSGTQAAVGDGDATRLWTDLNGRLQVFGTVGSITPIVVASGTVSLQTGGTIHVGSVQRVTGGTLDFLGGGTVRVLPPSGTVLGETFFSTIYTAAANDVSVIGAPGVGTFIRVYDILVSGSAAGTFRVLDSAEGTAIGHVFTAANGGWSFNSNRGVRTRAGNRAILIDCTSGTWGFMINYALETA